MRRVSNPLIPILLIIIRKIIIGRPVCSGWRNGEDKQCDEYSGKRASHLRHLLERHLSPSEYSQRYCYALGVLDSLSQSLIPLVVEEEEAPDLLPRIRLPLHAQVRYAQLQRAKHPLTKASAVWVLLVSGTGLQLRSQLHF